MAHLNIAFDRYASIGTVMHYSLVISFLDHSSYWLRRSLSTSATFAIKLFELWGVAPLNVNILVEI